MKPPHPPLAVEGVISLQSTFLVIDILRVKRLPFRTHPLKVFIEAKFITFSDTPFELVIIIFEEPLYSVHPSSFKQFGGRLQGSPKTTIGWSRMDPFCRVFFIRPSCVQLRFRLLGRTPAPPYLVAQNRGRYVSRIRPWGLGQS